MSLQCGKGLLRVICANGTAELMPVDFVNNMLLSIGWITALKKYMIYYYIVLL